MVKLNKTVYVINEKVSLHLHRHNCHLLIMGIVIPVNTQEVQWGEYNRILYRSALDTMTEKAVVQAVCEFHNPVQIKEHETIAA